MEQVKEKVEKVKDGVKESLVGVEEDGAQLSQQTRSEFSALRDASFVLQHVISWCCSGRDRRCLVMARPRPAEAPVTTMVWDIVVGRASKT